MRDGDFRYVDRSPHVSSAFSDDAWKEIARCSILRHPQQMRDRRLLFERARAMRRDATDAERRMWRILRGRQLEGAKFRRQVPLGPYIADFACFDPKIIVEVDGSQHAESAYDAERDGWFRAQGFAVLRFWNSAVLQEPDGVVDAIVTALR